MPNIKRTIKKAEVCALKDIQDAQNKFSKYSAAELLELRASNAYRLDISLLGLAAYGSQNLNLCQIGENLENIFTDESDSKLLASGFKTRLYDYQNQVA